MQIGKACPDVCGKANVKMPAASEKIRIEQSEITGRYAAAAAQIRVGDVLVVEKPYASVMQPEKYSSHCHHCFRA